ncbi:MAG: ORF6N domain-containing protein [Leptospirales bacterium]
MFRLLNKEFADLRSQIATTKDRGKTRSLPFVFSQNGIAMLFLLYRPFRFYVFIGLRFAI